MSAPATERLPEASLKESLAVVATGVLPSIARGLFKPRPRMVRLLTRLEADRRAVEVLTGVRRRHPGEGVRLLGGRLVVLWGPDGIREVLDRSADAFASDSGAKGKGMAHFQPDALTLSRGADWRDRRAFNEHVLATSQRLHPDAERFLAVIADEVDRLDLRHVLVWDDLERLFDRVTLRVVFGDRARDDQGLTGLLERRMAQANRLVGVGEPDGDYHELYGRIERHVARAEPGSLVARFADAPQTARTRIVQQVPHWLFAMRDTLGMNVARALAVVAGDAEVEHRVREELEGADPRSPEAIDGLRYLEGCLQEAMRLWPTTPLLAREATRATTVAGVEVDEGAQVLLLNVFNHRNAVDVPDADRFDPDRWAEGGRDYRYNHLSNGTQDCPGGPLVFLLGKGVLAALLDAHELDVREPKLDASAKMPYMLDPFAVRLTVRPRPHGA